MRALGLYIHWPFCESKCPYCDFNSHVRDRIDHKRWEQALIQDLEAAIHGREGQLLGSIFFGGGTPSLMAPQTIQALIEKATTLLTPVDDLEVTLEANPGSVEAQKFLDFRDAGVNRVSLGVQSLDPEALTFLGRRHSAPDALRAIELAASTFPRFSFDLIYARPHQTAMSWEQELERALSYDPSHLSLYQLTIEPQTAFATRLARGETMTLADDPAAHLYELTENIMETRGIPAYEVSNYAAPGQECRHNLLYWTLGEYIGIGPGAHGRLYQDGQKYATFRYKAPETWLKAVETKGHGEQDRHLLSPKDRLQELTLMGLRLTQGLSLERLYEETGLSPDKAYPGLSVLLKEGLVSLTPSHLIPSFEGRLRLNSLISFLMLK